MKNDLKIIMKVMRIAKGRGLSHFDSFDFLEQFVQNDAKYPLDIKTTYSYYDKEYQIDKTS